MADTPHMLNAQQAAHLLGAHVETVRRMARRRDLPAFKVGKDWRFNKSALLTWSKAQQKPSGQGAILVIDDDDAVGRFIRRQLEPLGHRVIVATNGAEGLVCLKKYAIRLILLDLQMPEMDGPTFIRMMSEHGLNVPIIIVTGHPEGHLMLEASQYGPLTLVPKPINATMLRGAVKMITEGAEAQQALTFELLT